jgi:hypothetical protein
MALPVFDNAQYEALLAQRRANDRQALSQQRGIYEAQLGALGTDANLIDARRRANTARLGTIGAQAGLIPIQRSINTANAGVIGAETAQLQGTRGLIGLQQQQLGQQQADTSLIRSARDNVADKSAVAQAGLAQNVEDSRLYGRLGVEAPVSVDVPAGQTGALGLGTRASIRTHEEIVRGQVADREADRAATLKGAQLALQMSGTNVTEAELMARRLGLTLADAKLMVDQAQTREAMAGVDVSNAQLDTSQKDLELQRMGINLNATKLFGQATALDINDMKAPGDQGYELYTDPVTRERSWKTPAEADVLQHDYEVGLTRQRLPETIQLARERDQAQKEALAKQNPMLYFDDSDFVWYLTQGSLSPDTSEVNRITQVREALRQKFPGITDDVLNTKVTQYINAAKVLQAKQRDEAEVNQPQPRKPTPQPTPQKR